MFTQLTIVCQVVKSDSSTVAVADSAKVMLRRAAEEFYNDPSGFLSSAMDDLMHFGLKFLAAVLLYIIGAWLIKKVKKIMAHAFEKRGTEKALSTFIMSLVTITLTVLLIILVVGTLGINTTSLAALLAAGGMAIGMALSGTVQNFAGGIMILIFKPFRSGDYIIAQGHEGYVEDVNIVNTRLRTFAHSTIVLPNGSLFNGTIENFSRKPYHRNTWEIGIPYGTRYEDAERIILDVLGNDDRILDSTIPGLADPSVHIKQLGASSVDLVVWAWVETKDYWPVQFKIMKELYDALPKGGVPFPFPQLDVHLDTLEKNA